MILSLSLALCFVATAMCLPSGLQPMLDGRIVGGKDVSIENYPWQISMEYSGRHRCGGSIYKKNVIVSAAHCVVGISASSVKIRVGTDQKGSGGKLISVETIKYHEKYSGSKIDYDVAILILSDNIEETNNTQKVKLIKREPADGEISHISGWGALKEGSSSPTQLQAVEVPIVKRSKCREAYGSSSITKRMICAGTDKGGKDACQGDSGGPLVIDGKLAGVVSWGYGCARPKVPGVYANVFYLRDWIKKNSKTE